MTRDELLKEIDKLPEEPRDAFVKLCDIISRVDLSKTTTDFDLFVIRFIGGFCSRYSISIPTTTQGETNTDYIRKITAVGKREADSKIVDATLEKYEKRTSDSDFGYAVLTADERTAVLARLTEIRNVIVSSKVIEKKKLALLNKLGRLEKEVHSERTPTDRFFGFLTDLAFVSGEMAKNAKPAIDEFKDVLRIIMRSRAKNEGLPSPDQWPQLPGPEDFQDQK